MTTHVKHHRGMAKASSSSLSVASFFRPQTSLNIIEAESLWSKFVAMHNISFQASDQCFLRMFPDSEAKKFSSGHTKTAAIIKEALSPHYLEKTLMDMSKFFSFLMDESNDKTDKSCIILVRLLDSDEGDVRTTFLDFPIINIGTAQKLFRALKELLSSMGSDFSKYLAFMSDTTNVMKGVSSGVQKLSVLVFLMWVVYAIWLISQ